MPCYEPLKGYRSEERNKDTGKRPFVFNRTKASAIHPEILQVPCGRCVGCLLDRSRSWAVRCMHEAQMYDDNCFITLTYNDEYLPGDGSLCKKDFQKFIKRLRKRFKGRKIRYFQCGEYGEKLSRPHFHACLFNFDFSDKESWSVKRGNVLYRSAILEQLWPFGFSLIGDVTFESAGYVARYVLKKRLGEYAEPHYKGKIPEYVTMSRRPGIGKSWYDKYHLTDVYNDDMIVMKGGLKCKPPRYYDQLFDVENPEAFSVFKKKRKEVAEDSMHNFGMRLYQRSRVKLAQAKMLRRNYEIERV